MASVLYATFFGGFSLAWPNRDGPGVVNDQDRSSAQLWNFMAYLCLNHQRQIPEADVIKALWGDNRVVDPTGTLIKLLSGAREALERLGFPNGSSVLLYRRGVYSWAPGVEFCLDLEELDRLRVDFAAEPEETLPTVLDMLSRCSLEVLPNGPRTPWFIALRTRYRACALHIMRGAIGRLGEQARYDEAIALCKTLTTMDPFDEWGQEALMRLLHASGATRSALWHYKNLTRLYAEQRRTDPPARLAACFQELSRSGEAQEPDLQTIRLQLEARDTLARPLYCEFNVFQTVYHLMARSVARTGVTAQLALLTMVSRNGAGLPEQLLDDAMETLRTEGLSSLREGDVCTRYSRNQYLLLLPSASLEDARMTVTRCLSVFEKTSIGQSVFVNTGVQPMLPIEL